MILIPLAVLLLLVIYLGQKLKQLPFLCPLIKRRGVYWVIYLALFIIMFVTVGRVSLGVILYLLMFYVIADVISFIIKRCGEKAQKGWKNIYRNGLLVIAVTAIACTYGYVHARSIKLTEYNISFSEQKALQEPVQILMVSDLHIGTSVKEKELQTLLQTSKERQPDIILLCGDIYDENTPEELADYSYDVFGNMEAPLGLYFVTGNHETYTDNYEDVLKHLRELGIHVLTDETILVNQQFYLTGRMDASVNRNGRKRATIEELVSGLDPSYPVVVLDHQPREYEENEKTGVDLILSGHTHAGQIFPGGFFSELANELNYGYKKIGSLQAIVSSGMGTWGFPMRVGTNSEIVMIRIE